MPGEKVGGTPRLHVITDDAVLARPGVTEVARGVLDACGGQVALHIRGPGTTGRVLYDLARHLVPVATAAQSLVVVNDRVDVALATGAHGVQLGARSLTVPQARAVVGGPVRVGVSVHSPEDAGAAWRAGADWVFAGTVYATPSHPGRRGAGPAGLEAAVLAAGGTPVLAIGGVTLERVADVQAAGAWGVAVIRGIWDASNPVVAAWDYLHELAAGPAAKPQEAE